MVNSGSTSGIETFDVFFLVIYICILKVLVSKHLLFQNVFFSFSFYAKTKCDFTWETFFISVCRIHYNDRVGPEGEITTDIIPIADTSSPGYPVNTPIDCTWEIDSKPNSRVNKLTRAFVYTKSHNIQKMQMVSN